MTNDLSDRLNVSEVDHVSTQDLANQIRRTIESTNLLDVSKAERVETMLSITRKPPRMQIRHQANGIDRKTRSNTENDLGDVATAGQDVLILGLASIVLRHENALQDVQDPKVLKGFEEVVMQLRMFEHLRLMTTAAGS
jgi:hypothetical protein